MAKSTLPDLSNWFTVLGGPSRISHISPEEGREREMGIILTKEMSPTLSFPSNLPLLSNAPPKKKDHLRSPLPPQHHSLLQ